MSSARFVGKDWTIIRREHRVSSNHTQSHIICEERLILLYYPFIIFIQFYTGGYNRYDTRIYILAKVMQRVS